VQYEYRERGKNGQWIWIMCRGRALRREEDGRAVRFVGVDTDITTLKAAEEAREFKAKQLEIAVTVAGIGIWIFSFATQTISWDGRLRRMYGLPDDGSPLPRDVWERAIHPDDLERILRATREAEAVKQDYSLEYRIIRTDGQVRHMRSRMSFLNDSLNGESLIGVNWDVTDDLMRALRLEQLNQIAEQRLAELVQIQTELERLSRHDPLTGLPNRRSLDEFLDRVAAEDGQISGHALMLIDIDHFKVVNDTHGHAFGDRMLQDIAGALEAELAHLGLLARTGGDEFLAIIDEKRAANRLHDVAQSAMARVAEVSRALGHEVSISIGIEARAEGAYGYDELFANADKAMYLTKQKNGARAARSNAG
jgi:diguanylate cyclase (GGDEF)-like protein